MGGASGPLWVGMIVAMLQPCSGKTTAAAVFYSAAGGWRVETGEGAGAGEAPLCEGTLKETYTATGWHSLSITGNTEATTNTTAISYACGMLEGHLTSNLIWENYLNMKNITNWTNADGTVQPAVERWFGENTRWVQKQTADPPKGSQWSGIRDIYAQMYGMLDGMNPLLAASGKQPLSLMEFVLFQSYCDIYDVQRVKSTLRKGPRRETHCSAFVRLDPVSEDIFFGHSTWFDYRAMLRMMKAYNTTGTKVVFSGFPGNLVSTDDFYITSRGIMSLETSTDIYKLSCYAGLPSDRLLYWPRAMLANSRADTVESWAEYFAFENGGTYNGEWIVVDSKKYQEKNAHKGVVLLAAQLPGSIVQNDVTEEFFSKGYWAGYNVPYNKQVYDAMGYPLCDDQEKCSYHNCSRARIFDRDAPRSAGLAGVQSMLRYNKFQTDPISDGNPMKAIASRGDLSRPAKCFGAIDAKVSSARDLASGKLLVYAQSGPTHDDQIPFSFSESAKECLPRHGLLNAWNFSWSAWEY
eukprot:Hpha_TRINITY_DN30061_c0_g1::TRINITY_DN30061_c0_g1_i1::g.21511::m.21511